MIALPAPYDLLGRHSSVPDCEGLTSLSRTFGELCEILAAHIWSPQAARSILAVRLAESASTHSHVQHQVNATCNNHLVCNIAVCVEVVFASLATRIDLMPLVVRHSRWISHEQHPY